MSDLDRVSSKKDAVDERRPRVHSEHPVQISPQKVVHCKREPFDVYIGRPSKWGNPFEIGRDGTREEVIEKYRELLIAGGAQISKQIREALAGKVLGCWCAPKACHGDVLAEIANSQSDAADVKAADGSPQSGR